MSRHLARGSAAATRDPPNRQTTRHRVMNIEELPGTVPSLRIHMRCNCPQTREVGRRLFCRQLILPYVQIVYITSVTPEAMVFLPKSLVVTNVTALSPRSLLVTDRASGVFLLPRCSLSPNSRDWMYRTSGGLMILYGPQNHNHLIDRVEKHLEERHATSSSQSQKIRGVHCRYF